MLNVVLGRARRNDTRGLIGTTLTYIDLHYPTRISSTLTLAWLLLTKSSALYAE
jgi:hypothetical protein